MNEPLNVEPVYELANTPLSTESFVLIFTSVVDNVTCSIPFTSIDNKL